MFEECGLPGGIQMTLLPYAIVAFFVYTVGFPLLLGYLLYRRRELIMEDQLLRAMRRGNTRLDNPNAYGTRKALHKLYYAFRPEYWFWVLIIIGRKFCIAFVALIFSRQAVFQLAVALLVLFVAYALQVRFSPFMSPSEYLSVVKQHERDAALGDARAQSLASTVASINSRGKKATHRVAGWGGASVTASSRSSTTVNFLWNYNTVEATLLFCAVCVALAGIMLSSGRFEDSSFDTVRLA